MPIDKGYAKKVYDSLKEDVDGFDKDEATFYDLMEKDDTYRQKVHATLKDVYGDEFDKDEATFDTALGVKKNSQANQTKSKPLSFGYSTPQEAVQSRPLVAPAPSIKNVSPSTSPSLSPKELVSKIKQYADQPNTASEDDAETSEYVTRLGDRAIRGMNSLNSMLAKTPEFIYNVAAVPQNVIAGQFDIPELATNAEKVKKDLGITNEIAQHYDNEVKALAYLDNKYSAQQGSIVKLVGAGNYKDAAKLLGEQIVESLPTTAAIAASGGLGATPTAITLAGGAVFGAGKYDELKDRADLSEAQKTAIAIGTGLTEGLFENIGTANLGRVVKDLLAKEGGEIAAKNLFVDTYKEALKKYMPISGAVSEGLEEAGTQFAQNAIDIYGGVDPDKKITDGVMDAFIVGSGSGAVISSPTLLSKKRNAEAVEKQSEIAALEGDIASENASPEVKQALTTARQNKMEELNTVIAKDVAEQKVLSDVAKREIETLHAQKSDIEQTLQSDISEESKIALIDRSEQIDEQIEQIVKQQKDEAKKEKVAEAEIAKAGEGVSDADSSLPATADAERVVEKEGMIKIHHGSGADFSLSDTPIYLTEDKSEAGEYAKNHYGEVYSYLINKDKIANEEYVRAAINELQLKTNEGNVVNGDEYYIHELIDQRFPDTAISEKDIKKLYDKIKEDGYNAIEFEDEGIGRKKNITSIFVVDTKALKPLIEGDTPATNLSISLQPEGESKLKSPTKTERKKIAEAKIDEVAQILKDFLPSAKGVSKSGLGQDEIIDAVAAAVKALVNSGIEINEAIKQVKAKLSEHFDISELNDKDIKAKVAPSTQDKIESLEKELASAKTDGKKKVLQEKIDELKNPTPGKEKPKSLLNRAFEGTKEDGVKKSIEKHGLTYEEESHELAKMKAKGFISDVGIEKALEAVRKSQVEEGAAAFVWAEIIDSVGAELASAKTPEEVKRLQEYESELIDEFDRKARSGGRFISALGEIYATSDFGYKASTQIEKYKKANNGVIPAEIEKKFNDLEVELNEVKKKLKEAEAKEAESKMQEAVAGISESVGRAKKRKPSIAEEGKRVASKIRKAKISPPSSFLTTNPALIVWDGAIEITAKAVESGAAVADAIKQGVEHIKASDWYKSIDEGKQKSAVSEFKSSIKEADGAGIEIIDGKIKIPHAIIRAHVESGITDPTELTKVIQKELSEDYPDVTERQVRDAISNYGETVNMNKEEIEAQIRKIKRIDRIISSLEDIAEKKRPKRSGLQRDTLDPEERSLNKELRQAMKDLPQDVETIEGELKTQLDAAKNRIKNQIDDLQREIDTKVKTPENARTVQEDAELKDLKERRDKLKEEHDSIFKNEEFKEAKRLEQTKKRTALRTAYLQNRLNKGDFSKKVHKPVIADTELTKLRAEKLRIQEEYNKEQYKAELENRSKWQKRKDNAWELWNIPRVLMATGEASFVGVQGLIQTIAHPKTAAVALKRAFTFFRSEEKTEQWLRDIKSQDWYPVLKGSGLALTEPNVELSAREELFYSGWTNIIWDALGWAFTSPFRAKGKNTHQKALQAWSSANPFKAFERAAIGYLDSIRVQRFLDGMHILETKEKTFENNKQDYKDVADAINTLTGRASLGKHGNQLAPVLAKVFFSPRNWASGIKTATPYALYHFGKMTPTARKMAIADFSKYLGLTTSIVMLAAAYLNNDDDDETGVEYDPRSSDFMKIKLGQKRIDPWGGKQQQVVLSARIMADALMKMLPQLGIKGAIKKDGELLPLGLPNRTKSSIELMAQQATNKLNPTASLAYNYLASHRDEDGVLLVGGSNREYSLQSELSDKFNPIFWNTVSELYKDDPNALNGLLAFYAFWGGGVNVYSDTGKSVSKNAQKIQRSLNKETDEEKRLNKEDKAIDAELQKKFDDNHEVTEEERELRKEVDRSSRSGAAIVVSELEKIDPSKREETFKRWKIIGIVPEGLSSRYEVIGGEVTPKPQ